MPWLLRAEAWDPATPGIRNLYFSDTGLTTTPSDTPASTYWQRRIAVPPAMVAAVFNGDALGGQASASFGAAAIANGDGALDSLNACTWDGHTVEVRYSALARPVLADFATVLTATIRRAVIGSEMVLELADRLDLTERIYAPAKFAGTGGAEGTADWAGVTKPRALGLPIQIAPAIIDEPNLVACYGDAAAGGVLVVRDRGVALRRGGNHPDYAAMMAASFGSADYVTCDALSMFRLRTPPAGQITADVIGRRTGTALVTNGDFAGGGTGWSTTGTGWAFTGGRLEKTAGVAGACLQNITTATGAWYVIGVTATPTAGSIQVWVAGVYLGDIGNNIRRAFAFQAAGTSTEIAVVGDAAFAGWVDDITAFLIVARAGEMLSLIADIDTPLGSGDIEAADVAALHSANAAALGLYTQAGEERQVPDVMDEIAATVGASWGFDAATGKLRMRRLEAPAGSADVAVVERQILDIRPIGVEHRLREQTVRWGRRWRPLREDDVGGGVIGSTRRALIAEGYDSVATHAATATEAKQFRDERLDSLFVFQASADAEAARRAALHGPLRLSFEVDLQDDSAIQPGITLRVTHPRFGLGAGRNFRVLTTRRDGLARTLTATIWG